MLLKPKLIIIVGATATSKTKLAKILSKKFNAEIINADAFQIFKYLNIGTNKSSPKEIKENDIHLIDIFELEENIDISIYQKLCNKKIKEIFSKNKNVIICGGSNLYIDAVIKGYNLDKVKSRQEIDYFNNWNYDDIYDYVLKNDYETAIKINKNNKKRIIRAAQIIYSLHTTKELVEKEKNHFIYNCLIIETIIERDNLYKKINDRVDLMMKNGWIHEVQSILSKYPNFLDLQSSKALGYSEIAVSLINNKEINWDLIKQKTRNYAKKQLTWNRNKYSNRIIFNWEKDNLEQLFIKVKKFLQA